jgi:hypothetical protein
MNTAAIVSALRNGATLVRILDKREGMPKEFASLHTNNGTVTIDIDTILGMTANNLLAYTSAGSFMERNFRQDVMVLM